MTDRSATSAPLAEIPARTPVSQPSPPAPGATIPTKNALASRQAQLDQHRQGVVQEITKASAELENVPEAEVTKRLSVRKKIKAAEDQLAVIAEEQASLDRQKETIAQEEQKARVEEAAGTRQQIQQDGLGFADTMRHILGLLEKNYSQWRELKDRDRISQDILRSLAPNRMTDLPSFDYACAVDQNFQIILGQVIVECRRSLAELQSRGRPLPEDMQERIVREQLGRPL